MSKALVVMLGAAAILGGGAWYMQDSHTPADSTDAADSLIPDLAKNVNDVTGFTIQTASETLRFERGEDKSWICADRGGFPADGAKIGQYLLALRGAELVERKTDNPESYGQLGLDMEAEDSKTTKVTVASSSGTLGEVYVGDRRQRGLGYYVRLEGDPACWIASGNLAVQQQFGQWIVKDVVDIARDRLVAAKLEHADGEAIAMANPIEPPDDITPGAQVQMELLNIPQGKEAQSQWITSRFGSALTRLTLDDVQAAEGFEWDPETETRSSFWTEDGLRIDVVTMERDEKLYGKLVAAYDPTGAPQPFAGPVVAPAPEGLGAEPAPAGDAAAAEGEEAEAEEPKTPEDIQAEAAELNTRHSPWVYTLPTFKKTALRARWDELVKDPEPPAGEGVDPGNDGGPPLDPEAAIEQALQQAADEGGETLEEVEQAAEDLKEAAEEEAGGVLEEAKKEASEQAETAKEAAEQKAGEVVEEAGKKLEGIKKAVGGGV